jgi:hypothetical protein
VDEARPFLWALGAELQNQTTSAVGLSVNRAVTVADRGDTIVERGGATSRDSKSAALRPGPGVPPVAGSGLRNLMDGFSIRERLTELKAEIDEIRQRDLVYQKRRHVWYEIQSHEERITRMKEILDEISVLLEAKNRGAGFRG